MRYTSDVTMQGSTKQRTGLTADYRQMRGLRPEFLSSSRKPNLRDSSLTPHQDKLNNTIVKRKSQHDSNHVTGIYDSVKILEYLTTPEIYIFLRVALLDDDS